MQGYWQFLTLYDRYQYLYKPVVCLLRYLSMLVYGNTYTNTSQLYKTIITLMIRPAGSPTATLLRLLPGSSQYDQMGSNNICIATYTTLSHLLESTQFQAATGGVYKRQGRNQRALMTHTYLKFLVHGNNYSLRSRMRNNLTRLTISFDIVYTHCNFHCSARAAPDN